MYIGYGTEYNQIQDIELMHSWIWVNVDSIKDDFPKLIWITPRNKTKTVVKGLIIHKTKLSQLGSVTRKGFSIKEESRDLLYKISNRYNSEFNWLGIDIGPNDLSNKRKIYILYSDNNLIYTNCQINVNIQLQEFKRYMSNQSQ